MYIYKYMYIYIYIYIYVYIYIYIYIYIYTHTHINISIHRTGSRFAGMWKHFRMKSYTYDTNRMIPMWRCHIPVWQLISKENHADYTGQHLVCVLVKICLS